MSKNVDKAKKIKVVCFGGGTGMPSLLSGLKHNPWLDITAVVNMFDTGGSSGELKDKFGILPPGDVLKCLLALSEDELDARKILLKRIDHASFSGHTGGNLLLFAFEKVYGNHLDAVKALSDVLSAKGKVLPVTSSQSTLCAKYTDGSTNKGETDIDKGMYNGQEVKELFLEPSVKASKEAVSAVKKADVLCIGPGSFYTSVLPNFLPAGIKDAIKRSKSPVIFTSNFLSEGLGMKGYKVGTVVSILEKYIGRKVSAIITNSKLPDKKVLQLYASERKYPIRLGSSNDKRVITADLWSDPGIARHDPYLLANLVFSIINRLV